MRFTSRHLPLSIGLLALGAIVLGAITARSDALPRPPAGSATASTAAPGTASGMPSATAAPSGSAAATSSVPLPRGADIPVEPSDPVKDKEWDAARPVRALRADGGTCRYRILRDWLRIDCDHRLGASLVAGDPKDVHIRAKGDPGFEIDSKAPNQMPVATITLRLARGDSKVFNLTALGWTYETEWAENAERLIVTWRAGAEDPLILISR